MEISNQISRPLTDHVGILSAALDAALRRDDDLGRFVDAVLRAKI